MLKNGRSYATSNLHNDGCSCCNTKPERRRAKKRVKAKEKRQWRKSESKDN